MTKTVNLNAKQLIQSQSPNAPFIAIFEEDDNTCVFYAVSIANDQPDIVDQIVFPDDIDQKNIMIQWNMDGDRAALICNEVIIAILDFKQSITFFSNIVPNFETNWARQLLEFSPELFVEFAMDDYVKQPYLDRAIEKAKDKDSQFNRLCLYKELLTATLFVPITTENPDDPNALIYTFPNNFSDNVDNQGNLICSFTNQSIYDEQIGKYGLISKKIMADYCCYQAQKFDNILGITVTSNNGHTVLVTREEFKLLSLIAKPQRLDKKSLLSEFGNVFFEDQLDGNREQVSNFYHSNIKSIQLIRSAFYCKPTVGDQRPLFCIIVKSSKASSDLSDIVSIIKQSNLEEFCDCHVFSLSDIIAQALDQSKTPL